MKTTWDLGWFIFDKYAALFLSKYCYNFAHLAVASIQLGICTGKTKIYRIP